MEKNSHKNILCSVLNMNILLGGRNPRENLRITSVWCSLLATIVPSWTSTRMRKAREFAKRYIGQINNVAEKEEIP